jgi:hypothetical protein
MSNVTPRENDVIAVARLALFKMADREGESFDINYEVLPEFLGTILLLEARLKNPKLADKFSGPREYAEYIIKQGREATSWIRLGDG